jgi:hypothetical protein
LFVAAGEARDRVIFFANIKRKYPMSPQVQGAQTAP